MPSVDRLPVQDQRLYSVGELIVHRRSSPRYARSFLPGTERNRHRQVAFSLGRLFKDNERFASSRLGG